MLKKSFRVFAVPLFQDNYSYIIQTGIKQPLLLVDPANPEIILDCLSKYFSNQQVGHILYTHKHWDHAGSSEDLFKLLSAKDQKLQVMSGSQDASQIKTVTKQIQTDDDIKLGNVHMRVYKVPCHTRGHVVYHLLEAEPGAETIQSSIKDEMQTTQGKKIRVFDESQCAFTGDTLFSGAIGKFFEGNASEMYTNLKKLTENISKDCSIFNGHEYTLQAIKWGLEVEPENESIKKYISELEGRDQATLCTLPTTLQKQAEINVFLRAVLNNHNQLGVDGIEYLRILREAKNKGSNKLQEFK